KSLIGLCKPHVLRVVLTIDFSISSRILLLALSIRARNPVFLALTHSLVVVEISFSSSLSL
ncbi:hypothetical protein, partial [Megamonas funiformis]